MLSACDVARRPHYGCYGAPEAGSTETRSNKPISAPDQLVQLLLVEKELAEVGLVALAALSSENPGLRKMNAPEGVSQEPGWVDRRDVAIGGLRKPPFGASRQHPSSATIPPVHSVAVGLSGG